MEGTTPLHMLVVGIAAMGSEYRHNTRASTYLATPRRFQVLLGKAATLLLFGLLYLLEDVGYLARAAFVVDRLMGRVGLEGRAFVALLSSYACAVPGMMPNHPVATIF